MRLCSVNDCELKHDKHGYCSSHWYASNKYGDPLRKLKRRDGISKHPLYITYHNMLGRCYDTKDQDYARYGGRGITVCKEWRDNIDNFINDMHPKPSAKHSLNRIDNNKGYSADNCEWSTPRDQALNTVKSGDMHNVYWSKRHNKWYVQGYIDKQYIYGGYFEVKEEAIRKREMIGL